HRERAVSVQLRPGRGRRAGPGRGRAGRVHVRRDRVVGRGRGRAGLPVGLRGRDDRDRGGGHPHVPGQRDVHGDPDRVRRVRRRGGRHGGRGGPEPAAGGGRVRPGGRG